MRHSLKTKMSLSYVLIIVVCVGIVIWLANALLETQFRDYVTQQQKREAQSTVSMIAQRYEATGNWDVDYIENLGMNALENGLIIKVTDSKGAVVWDAATHNNGLCQQMLTNMSANMKSRYSRWEGGYQEAVYDVNTGGGRVGSVSVGYYGPFYYTDQDLYFINTINSLLIFAGAVSILLALVIGIVMSRQISRPISRVIDKAQMITQGFYGSKVEERSKTVEIRRLVDTVNNLGETLQQQEMLSKQTSMDIAHELRTPLTTMQGNLEAVMDGVMVLDDDRVKMLHDQIMRLNRLVDDLSELARFESLSFKLNTTSFDLCELAQSVVLHFQNDFATQNKTLSFQGNRLIITADTDKLSQVLVNLVSNALKFTREGDSVTVSIKDEKQNATIIVKDTGIGVSEADLPHIFERFYRADKSRSRKTGGAGIGLTIVKSIILAHGGTIAVNSKPDEGTEFIITIPKEPTEV